MAGNTNERSPPLKRRRYPKPRKVTVRHVDPQALRPGECTLALGEEPQLQRVDPDHFERIAALKAERRKRDAINVALRPGDRVRVPERTNGLIRTVQSVDLEAHTATLCAPIFGRRRKCPNGEVIAGLSRFAAVRGGAVTTRYRRYSRK